MPYALSWMLEGQRIVIVTLVDIEGASPRDVGAQMVVSETGQYCGYISSGCIEAVIVERALSVLQNGKNECVRYGKGSQYMDIVLPCGSGIDLYFDQEIDIPLLEDVNEYIKKRKVFSLETNLDTGQSRVLRHKLTQEPQKSCKNGHLFIKVYIPGIRLVVFGAGPSVRMLIKIGLAADLEIDGYTSDQSTYNAIKDLGSSVKQLNIGQLPQVSTDQWTASVLMFHDHNWEIPILKELVKSECFYIGAQGSFRVQQDRIESLRLDGCTDEDIARLTAPIGIIEKTKNAQALAISTLAQILDQAKKAGLSC